MNLKFYSLLMRLPNPTPCFLPTESYDILRLKSGFFRCNADATKISDWLIWVIVEHWKDQKDQNLLQISCEFNLIKYSIIKSSSMILNRCKKNMFLQKKDKNFTRQSRLHYKTYANTEFEWLSCIKGETLYEKID
ncbi:hypothetical protein WN51_01988 [Melipona quadrifasciata]|uniref:Uncharacterized protein n=1 Tax=Melipona quadrifasciata TaxID=166423 RepID=A0A0M9AAU5_9HYME|nr:hypothetical protein WN51_01988 [Melipona quadrifasciata]